MTIARIDPSWPILTTDWTAQLGGLLIGKGTPYRIAAIDGLGMPVINTSDQPRAARHGSWSGLDLAASRDITFEINIVPGTFGGSLYNYLTAFLNAWSPISTDTALALRIPGLGPIILIGRPRKVDAPFDLMTGGGLRAAVGAMFTATDPFKYSAAVLSTQVNYGTSGTNEGLPFNAGSFAGMTFAPPRIIANGGFDEPTTPPWVTTAGTSGLILAGATLTRDTGTFHSTPASGKVVTSGSSINQGVRQATLTNLLPNTSYTFSVWVFLATAGGIISLILKDITNGISSEIGVPSKVTTTGSWQQMTFSLATGANGPVQVEIALRDEGTAVTRTFYVDDVRGDLSSSVQNYTDDGLWRGALFGAVGGGQGSSGFGICNSNGTELSAPVSRIYAAGGNITGPIILERVESGEDVIIDYSMISGDVIELDHDLHSLTLNGGNRTDLVDVLTSWWQIWPGKNTIHFRTASPSPGSYAQILWRDAIW